MGGRGEVGSGDDEFKGVLGRRRGGEHRPVKQDARQVSLELADRAVFALERVVGLRAVLVGGTDGIDADIGIDADGLDRHAPRRPARALVVVH